MTTWFYFLREFFFNKLISQPSVYLLLRPRKFKRKNVQKKRYFRFYTACKLRYGQYGLKIMNPMRLTSQHVFRHKLFLKKGSRRSENTYRRVWFNIFPHIPLTRKVVGSRMGKGKGKLDTWVAQVAPGVIIFEFKNLRSGRAKYFLNQVSSKIPAKTQLINWENSQIPLVMNKSTFISYDSFL